MAPECLSKQLVSQISQENLRQLAESITVQVMTLNSGGSGILIGKQGQVYTVVTTNHNLTAGKPYSIKTADGQIHQANLVRDVNFARNDLSILQFRAEVDYPIAELGEFSTLAVKQEVFAAGLSSDNDEFVFTTGKISLLPDQALQGGYRIGYTNKIKQGMSGGPILNSRGQVIGLNAMYAFPIWGDPYVFEDGSHPSNSLKKKMRGYSWGLPIQTVVESIYQSTIVPQLAPANLVDQVDKIAGEITVLITNPRSHGSGVIVAGQNNTYSVLTAEHILRNVTQFQIITPDGRCYPVNYNTVKTLEGVDLAVFEFQSKIPYQVATLANYEEENKSSYVYLSGWPATQLANPAPKHWLSSGRLISKQRRMIQAQDSFSLTYGYELLYSNITVPGMSGGPVLDSLGRVIGIHGRAEGAVTGYEPGAVSPIQLGYSLGIPIRTFLGLAKKVGIEPESLTIETSLPPSLTEEEIIDNKSLLKNLEVPTDSNSEIAWLNYGNQLWRLEEYEEALSAFNRAIELKPSFYQAWYAKGLTLRFQGRYQEAMKAFDRAIEESQENFAPAWRGRGQVLASLNRYREALVSFDKAIILKPRDFALNVLRGEVLHKLERSQEAIAAYTKAIKINPHPFAYYNRANIHSNLGDYQAAIADYSKAIKVNPNYPQAYNNRGINYYDLGEYQEAIADYTKAIALNPSYIPAYNNRAYTRYILGEKERAIEDVQQVAEIYKYKGDTSNYQKTISWLRQLKR